MLTSETPSVDLAIRSYGAQPEWDRHAFAQLVLPLSGEVRLEIEGRHGRLDPLHGAFVAPGAWHAQAAVDANRSLILDIDSSAMTHDVLGRLAERPFTPLGPAVRKLVEFMELMAGGDAVRRPLLRGWVPLLLDALALETPQPRSKLAALLAQVEASPGLPWSTQAMARVANLSASRLHALFREEQGTSPHAWLLERRLDFACRCLAGSAWPIAEVALRAGFADQAGLTRALRRHRDTTPAAYRRAQREPDSGREDRPRTQ